MGDVENGKGGGGLQIVFKNLSYTVKQRKKGTTKKAILDDVSGVMEPARLTAVMGASGAGKTTLLNVLAGFARSNGGQNVVQGGIAVNGTPVSGDKMRKISGFVHQEDVILHTMTVREALTFSAMLKLPGSMPGPQKAQRALDIAYLLNLHKSLDSVVGSAMIKGISGGEKRRLSLGMEMVTEPSILFLDEPSSGLDAFNAFKVVHILRSVAHRHRRTVVCTIHQPSSECFHMFDSLLVLAAGQVIYQGDVTQMVDWFASVGYQCPNYTNPADFLFMEVLNAAVLQDETSGAAGTHSAGPADAAAGAAASNGHHHAQPLGISAGPAGSSNHASPAQVQAGAADAHSAEDERIAGLIAAWKGSHHTASLQRAFTDRAFLDSGVSKEAEGSRAPFALQWLLLAQRAARNAWRNPLVIKGKLAQTIFLSLVGRRIAAGPPPVCTLQGLFGSTMGILTVFGAEKVVFQREYGNGMYGLPAYFISRWAVELPFQVVMPVMSAVICYWMIGYQNIAEKFGWFALTLVLMDTCGAGLGIFVSCIFNDLSVALSVMPMFLLPLMVFSGFFVNSNTIPPYFAWQKTASTQIQYISPMRYGFLALSKNEFSGLQINCTPDQDCAPGFNGETVLRNMGFDTKGSVEQNAGILFAMLWGLLVLAYIALWLAVRRLS
ncbi:ABC transporter G family member 1, partial [Tetrabaena socialis]